MLNSLPINKPTSSQNNIVNSSIKNYNPIKTKSNPKSKKIVLNKMNNSSININNNISNIIIINKKTKSESNSLNKSKKSFSHYKGKVSTANKNIVLYRNNLLKNNLNKSLNSANNTEKIKRQYNFIFSKKQTKEKNNNNKSFRIDSSNKKRNIITKSKKKSNSIQTNLQKSENKKKSKTPVTSAKMSKNNSKKKERGRSSKDKKLDENLYKKNNILLSGANININKIKNDLKNKLKNKVFQSNNIFAKFKPKKKTQTFILQDEIKHNSLLSKFLILSNIDEKQPTEEKTNKCLINPKTSKNEIENDESTKEICPLTNNTTNMNILQYNKSSSTRVISSNIKPQQLNISIGNNNANNNINSNNNSTILFHNFNIQSAQSLITSNTKNISTNVAPQPKPKEYTKKIKCIHDISKTGLSGDDKKINQDRYFIFRNFVNGFDNIFMGVCDGHGYYGHEVSEYIKENLPMDLNRIIKTKKLDINKDDLSEVIINAFVMENNSLLRNKQIDSDVSGSTCVSVIYTPKKLIIANLGDSRCVLGKCINSEWKFENLSRDHKPDVKEEAERIKNSGGRIRPMIDDEGCFVGPPRVYMKDKDLPGLAMTRSFGDYFASLAGTIAIPEIKEHELKPEDKFLILASDGLFEFLNSEQVGNIIKDYYNKNDVVGCCEFLYKESYRKWIVEEEDTVDDITIILVFFED